ncbi:MAG: hypothetical protein LBE49_06290 [Deltaproteobacteria bacterium]|jgi:hypothetical protein|nr:hypothetical protein [Deltaproteobacteria bacterium]
MTQVLDQALAAYRTDGDIKSLGRALKASGFQTIISAAAFEASWEAPPVKVLGRHRGQEVFFLPAFGGLEAARGFLAKSRERITEKGELRAASIGGARLLAQAEVRGLGLWLEPGDLNSSGSQFLSASEVASLLEPGIEADDGPEPMCDLDFSKPRTLEQLCQIFFDESPAELGIRLGRLEEGGVVEARASLADPGQRAYEPLAAFYLGLFGQGGRSREFRDWFRILMKAAYFERGSLALELMALGKDNRELKRSLEFSESFKQKVKREYQKLKAKSEESAKEAAANLESAKGELEREREARRREGAVIARLYREIVALENDLMAAEEWPYPLSLEEAMEAAERLYSSKLAIMPGRARVEVSEPALARDPRLISEAVRALRLLAVDLHPMRFKYGNLDPEAFGRRTGLKLVIPAGRAAATGTNCARKVNWRGRDIVCDSYLQNTREDFRLLLHFKDLNDDKRFLVSHVTAFAMSGFLKLVPGGE